MSFFWLSYVVIWLFQNIVISFRIMVVIIGPNKCESSFFLVEISSNPLTILTTTSLSKENLCVI